MRDVLYFIALDLPVNEQYINQQTYFNLKVRITGFKKGVHKNLKP